MRIILEGNPICLSALENGLRKIKNTNAMPMILSKWEKLIATLDPLNQNLKSLPEKCIQNLINQSQEEQENVRDFLIEGIIERPNVPDKQHYVQVNQAMLIRLIDKIYSYQQSQAISSNVSNAYKSISLHLESALSFIEDFFSNYFDRNTKVPAPYLSISVEELCKHSETLQKSLQSNTNIDCELKNIIINNFKRFCIQKMRGATYNELIYQKDLMKELLTSKALESEISIRVVLFYFNFNDREYVAYFYSRLNAIAEPLSTKTEKISALRLEQKKINQLAMKLNCCLCCSMPSLKEQINHWIEEEIKFLEADLTVEKIHNSDIEPEDKIQTSLSVAKLALLIRLMVADKIITNRVVAHILRTVAKIFTTLNRENISFGSLETKYHNPDRGTISAVKDMLFRWINMLSKL